MTPLVLSLLSLVLGPILYRMARSGAFLLAFLDGFMLVAIGGLVLIEIIPHAFDQAGWWVFLMMFAGLYLPSFLEQMKHHLAERVHKVALFVALFGLLAHSFFDGFALYSPEDDHNALPLAVVLHRFPVGLTIWHLLRPNHGVRVASIYMVLFGLATVAGFEASEQLIGHLDTRGLGLFSAFVAGALLHVVVHSPNPLRDISKSESSARSLRAAGGMGALGALAVGAVLAAEGGHGHAGHDHAAAAGFGADFMELAIESAPVLLIAYLAAGLIHSFLPKASIAWMGRGGQLSQTLRGVAFGLPLPICSCGVLPIYRGLVLQGVPPAAAMAFLVATPELGIDAIALSFKFLGESFSILRVVCVALVATVIGLVMGRLVPRQDPAETTPADSTERLPLAQRAREAVSAGFGEMVDLTGPWIVFGIALAAVCFPLLNPELISRLGWAQVPLFALLGMPTYVCASGATPLIAVFIAGGVSPGAGLAFLLTGPATNVTTFGILSQLHGRKVAVTFGLTMAGFAVASGYFVNSVLPEKLDLPALLDGTHDHGSLSTFCLYVLALLLVLSLLRQGPRAFIGQVLSQASEGHDHGHSHDHGPPDNPSCSDDHCH